MATFKLTYGDIDHGKEVCVVALTVTYAVEDEDAIEDACEKVGCVDGKWGWDTCPDLNWKGEVETDFYFHMEVDEEASRYSTELEAKSAQKAGKVALRKALKAALN